MSIRIDGANTTTNPGITGADTDTGLAYGTNEVKIVTDATDRVTVNNTGMGIGTASPSGLLAVHQAASSTSNYINITNNATGSPSWANGMLVGVNDAGDALCWQNENQPLRFGTNNTDKARLDSSGRLLVGTTASPTAGNGQYANLVIQGYPNTPAGAGHISLQRGQAAFGANNQIGLINFGDNTGASYAGIECYADADSGANDFPGRLVFSTSADGASSPTARMRLDSSGRLLVGRTTSTAQGGGNVLQTNSLSVEVASDTTGAHWNRTDSDAAWVAMRFYARNSLSGFIQVNTSSVTYATSSDYRLKENVVNISGAIDRVKQFKPKRFNFIREPGITVDGFLAHEAQAVVPESVGGTKDEVDDEGNAVMQGIDQAKLVPLLTAALQEAIAKIETLETKVAALEAG